MSWATGLARSFIQKSTRYPWPPLLTALVLALISWNLPIVPSSSEVDLSLIDVLNYAHQNHLQFGPEITSTYGPLGWLYFPYYSQSFGILQFVVQLMVALAALSGLCLAAWRLTLFWRCILLGVFTWAVSNMSYRADLLVETGLLCWGLLSLVETNRRLLATTTVFAISAALASLAKVSFLFIAAASVGCVTADLLLRGKRRAALGLLVSFFATFLFGWLVAGQNLFHLGAFLGHAFNTAQSYDQALGLEGLRVLRQTAFFLASLLLVLVGIRSALAFDRNEANYRLRRGLLFVWLSIFTFASWKHGFLRLDGFHPPLFLGFCVVAALVTDILCSQSTVTARCSRALAVLCVIISAALLQTFFFSPLPGSLAQPFREGASHFIALLQPRKHNWEMERYRAAIQEEYQLPRSRQIIGQNSVDVFGQYQSFAIDNHLNYKPRPVFQSYNACNRSLMSLNQNFYLSNTAPRFVLFDLKAMDDKFPPLEDGSLLRHLLINYQPVLEENRFVLLEAKSAERCHLSLLREERVQFGQRIDFQKYGETSLWLEIELTPSFRGSLRQLFYASPVIRLAAWGEPGKSPIIKRRAPPEMLAAGFLASPLLQTTVDVQRLFAGERVRPTAYSVEAAPGQEALWRKDFRVRVYKIENAIGAGPKETHTFTLFRNTKWHPTREQSDLVIDRLTFCIFILLPGLIAFAFVMFYRRLRRLGAPVGWARLLVGNALVLLFLLSTVLLLGETWFRLLYDTTDALGFTKICERWISRHWQTNVAGCRDNVEYSAKIQANQRRITFVGDSFTAGHGIRNVDARFSNRIRAAHPDWEVHVLANVGLDTGDEVKLVKKALSNGYQLDEVVLVYCLNDVGDLLGGPGGPFEGKLPGADDRGPSFIHGSYLLDFIYNRYQAGRNPYVKDYFSFVKTGYRDKFWEQQKQRLKEFRDLVESHGGRLSVVTFPFLHALGANYDYRFAHAELDQFWRELNVPHLDLLPIYQALPARELTVNRFDAHPNEYANQLAAEAIDKFLSPRIQGKRSAEANTTDFQ
jgi:hypothetical protein